MSDVRQEVPRGLRWTGRGATLVLVLLCSVLALALAAGVWWERQRVDARPGVEAPVTSVGARDTAREVAGPLTERVLSYAWNDFDRRVADTRGLLSAGYAREYDAQMAGLREDVVGGRVTVRATATQVGTVSAAPDRAVALVFLDQVSSTAGSDAERVDEVRVLVTLTPEGREWRVARLDAF